MINQFYITGDCHGDFSRFYKLHNCIPEGETWGVVILGDAGINYWLSKRDEKIKCNLHYKYPNLRFYLVRGNHEERPEKIKNMEQTFDMDLGNYVYYEAKFPNIKYLMDGEFYNFKQYKALILGGAYSIDKEYRLARQASGGYGGWFAEEQLTDVEKQKIAICIKGAHCDFVLSHTCPFSWEPRDLFLSFIDQAQVDKSTELWLDDIKDTFNWKKWLCGHFHDDRELASNAYMLYTSIRNIKDFMEQSNE